MPFNSFLIWLLRSRLYWVLGKGLMLVMVTGTKSGKTYTTPVNYLREGNTLWVTSLRDRTWWRNLRGGAPMRVWLAGKELPANGRAIEDEQEVIENLTFYFQKAPQTARFHKVTMDASAQPLVADLARVAHARVMISIDLL